MATMKAQVERYVSVNMTVSNTEALVLLNALRSAKQSAEVSSESRSVAGGLYNQLKNLLQEAAG